MRHRERELQPYNLDQQEGRGGEELEKTAVSRKPFRELSCNSNVRSNLVPEDDRKILRRIVCVKLKDDIHNPGEMNGHIMALKEHVKARYRLSDLTRAQKNDKMTSNLSTEKTYSITQLMGWWHAREKMRRRYYTSITSSYCHSCIRRKCFSDRRIKWDTRG